MSFGTKIVCERLIFPNAHLNGFRASCDLKGVTYEEESALVVYILMLQVLNIRGPLRNCF